MCESKGKVTLSSSKKVDRRSVIKGKRNEEVRMCYILYSVSPTSEVQ